MDHDSSWVRADTGRGDAAGAPGRTRSRIRRGSGRGQAEGCRSSTGSDQRAAGTTHRRDGARGGREAWAAWLPRRRVRTQGVRPASVPAEGEDGRDHDPPSRARRALRLRRLLWTRRALGAEQVILRVTQILRLAGLVDFSGIAPGVLEAARQRGTAVHSWIDGYHFGTQSAPEPERSE